MNRFRECFPRPLSRLGFFVPRPLWPAALVVLGAAVDIEAQSILHGRILDNDTGAPITGAVIQARAIDLSSTSEPSPTQTQSDSAGVFDLNLGAGQWRLQAQCIGYRQIDQQITVDGKGMTESVVLRLEPQPLLLDEMVVRMRRSSEGDERTAGFVEVIKVADGESFGADLPGVLDRALGLQVRRYGGLGSSASVSIRGSSSEQVLVYLDGVPLNQASGGGVDIGYLPLAGVEEIEVYRGAVPIRFGGNSIGGVVHMRTAVPEGKQLRLYANGGSFATRVVGGSVSGDNGPWKVSGLADYRAAENDFRFLDDNGTEYNLNDDEWVRRENSDFLSFRGMAKAWRPIGSGRVRVHNIVDVSHHGIPGIGNYQSKHTRYDTWRNLAEAEVSGTTHGSSAYRLTGYHAVEVGEYQDPLGEVGVGAVHDRNTTRSFGLKVEGHTVLPRQVLLTGFSSLRRESFATDDLLGVDDPFEDSRRHAASLATEVEIPLHGDRVLLNAGTHVELLSNRLATTDEDFTSDGHNDDSMRLWGYHAGGRWQLSRRFSLRVNAGSYQRPPSFFELFGDRGGVIGNGDLASEEGWNWDSGLIYEAQQDVSTGLVFAEAVWYQNRVDNMIRFVQNSQFVSQPHNFGSARLSGLETRARLRLRPFVHINGNYAYQRAENRSPLSYERGNDLPNAPRHALSARVVASSSRGAEAHYELGRDSRHFLDRANLQPVAARTLHGVGVRINLPASASLALEVRNVTDNQTADLWGFPLPGRSLFASIQMSSTGWPTKASSQ
jgi:outer membrane cobalamin receptor